MFGLLMAWADSGGTACVCDEGWNFDKARDARRRRLQITDHVGELIRHDAREDLRVGSEGVNAVLLRGKGRAAAGLVLRRGRGGGEARRLLWRKSVPWGGEPARQ